MRYSLNNGVTYRKCLKVKMQETKLTSSSYDTQKKNSISYFHLYSLQFEKNIINYF